MSLGVFISSPQSVVTTAKASTVSSMDSKDREVFKSIVGDTSNIVSVNSSISTDVSGEASIDSYYWTAWYNKNTRNFTIDKTKTKGDYLNGFPKSTTGSSTSTNFNKIGYYKYLRDPIYNKITLVAHQTFNWVEKVEKTDTKTITYKDNHNTVPADVALETGEIYWSFARKYLPDVDEKTFSKKIISAMNLKYYSGDEEVDTRRPDAHANNYSGSSHSTLSKGNDIYRITVLVKNGVIAKGYHHSDIEIIVEKETKITYFVEESHSKTIKIAETTIVSNVSATELAKYSSFSLVWKGSSKSANNTTVNKYAAGWWGVSKPEYHQGNSTTSDTSGTYYCFSNSLSGTGSWNAYSMISKKEKVFTEQAVDLTVPENPDYKYTVVVDPNGGSYKGSSSKQSISQKVNTTATIARPVRSGYTFLGYNYVGEGTWNSASGVYTFTGDGTLTAKWKNNNGDNGPGDDGNGPGDDGNNPGDNNPNNPNPGTPNTPSNPDNSNKPGSPDNTVVSNIRYTLKINPNGGKYNSKSGITTVNQKEGAVYSVAPPTRSGYLFDGWTVTSGNASYFTQSKYTLSSTYVFYGNATIQAKWLKRGSSANDTSVGNAQLTIDPNGGLYEGNEDKQTFTQAAGTTKAINTPSRDGYRFIGWEIDTNNDVNGIFNTSNNSFIFKRGTSTLKARWKQGNPPSCIMDGTGANACPDSERDETINKFVHLTKNVY